jgi:hypothetical protein
MLATSVGSMSQDTPCENEFIEVGTAAATSWGCHIFVAMASETTC